MFRGTIPHFNSTSANSDIFYSKLWIWSWREKQSPSLQGNLRCKPGLSATDFTVGCRDVAHIYIHTLWKVFIGLYFQSRSQMNSSHPVESFLSDYTFRCTVHTSWFVVNWFHRRLQRCFSGLGILKRCSSCDADIIGGWGFKIFKSKPLSIWSFLHQLVLCKYIFANEPLPLSFNQEHKETILPPWHHVFEGHLVFLSIIMVPQKYESIWLIFSITFILNSHFDSQSK